MRSVLSWDEEYCRGANSEGKDHEFSLGSIELPACSVKLVKHPSTKNSFGCLNGQKRWDREGHQQMQGDLASLDEVGTEREPRLPGGLPACKDQVVKGWQGGVGREEAGRQERGAVSVMSSA